LSALTQEVGHMPPKQALTDHLFTRGLSEAQIDGLAGMACQVAFEDNELVLADGARSTSVFLLLTGSVVVELRTPQYAMRVQVLGPGSVFGWSALLDDQDTLFQVRARERTTALQIHGATLRAHCMSDPALGVEFFHRILRVVARRVKATEMRFAEMCGVRVSSRFNMAGALPLSPPAAFKPTDPPRAGGDREEN
jgi:CRP/FNR family transcriptional regulator, cyclic AMP receptor protein